jgi:hypothetical protein
MSRKPRRVLLKDAHFYGIAYSLLERAEKELEESKREEGT